LSSASRDIRRAIARGFFIWVVVYDQQTGMFGYEEVKSPQHLKMNTQSLTCSDSVEDLQT
jgi:hypothetical protein